MRLLPAATMILASACLSTIGCGPGADPNRRPTAPVTVTLTMEGKPVADAMVIFIATEKPMPAAGKTDANGVAQLTTYETGDGAVIGLHKVQVLKTEATTAMPAAELDSEAYDPEAIPTNVQTKSLVPGKYTNSGTSGFTADVKTGANAFKFDMKSK